MADSIKAGDTVPLVLQLFDGATNKHVQAVVTNQAGTAVSGSPFTLTHQALGKYVNSALAMPSGVSFIVAQYFVYDDAGFTTISSYADTSEVFNLFIDTSNNYPSLEAMVNGNDSIEGIVYGGSLKATLEEDET